MINLQSTLDRYRAARRSLITPYISDPVAWAHDLIDWPEGQGPSEYQDEILTSLGENERTAVRAPRGSGKTAPAAWAAWWFATTRDGDDWKNPTTAGSWLQLKRFLWPEIHKWARRIRWDRLGRERPTQLELLTLRMALDTGESFAINSRDADLLEGAHAEHLLAIIDEGKAVPDKSWDAIEGYFSDPGEKLALALSVPGAPIGRFFDICMQNPGYEEWHPIHVTIDRALAADRIRPEWVDARRVQWGEDSALFKNHVLAEFGGEPDATIPLAWIELAMNRESAGPRVMTISADIADTGSDETIIAYRGADEITEFEEVVGLDLMGQAERITNRLPRGGLAVIDSIGIGAGVFSRVKQLVGAAGRVVGFVASEGTKRRDASGQFRFRNKRSAAWWGMRELLDPESGFELVLPRDDMLLGDLAAPKWSEHAGGVIQVESKDDIKKRLGRSTDRGDAVVMAFWGSGTAKKRKAFAFPDDALAGTSPWAGL